MAVRPNVGSHLSSGALVCHYSPFHSQVHKSLLLTFGRVPDARPTHLNGPLTRSCKV